MKLLHGTNEIIRWPDINKCKSKNAFAFDVKAAKSLGLKVLQFDDFTVGWARFIIQNRDVQYFSHSYDIVIGPVADAILDTVLFTYKKEFGERYLDDEHLKVFIDRMAQFGSSYIQYCFCTQKAMDSLRRI